MKKFVILWMLLILMPVSYAEYFISSSCDQPCLEGSNVSFNVSVWYDVIGMANKQKELYEKENILAQTYVSKISINKIILKEKISDWEFAEKNTNIVFADSRIKKNKNLSSVAQSTIIDAIIPSPKSKGELSIIPCFEIEYEKELKEFDFFEGNYDLSFLVDNDVICGDEIFTIAVKSLPPPLCMPGSCVFYKHCTPNGCRFSWSIIFYSVLIVMVFVTLGEWLRNKK